MAPFNRIYTNQRDFSLASFAPLVGVFQTLNFLIFFRFTQKLGCTGVVGGVHGLEGLFELRVVSISKLPDQENN